MAPDRRLYIAETPENMVVVRRPNGDYYDVAGNGLSGFSGDGGPAVDARLSEVYDIAFSPRGLLYIADGSRVRMVNASGKIVTVVGGGTIPPPTATTDTPADGGIPALQASLGPILSLAFSPSGQLYLSDATQLLTLLPSGYVVALPLTYETRSHRQVPVSVVGAVAVPRAQTIYVWLTLEGGSIYVLHASGPATYVARAHVPPSGAAPGSLQAASNGKLLAIAGSELLQLTGLKAAVAYRFPASLGQQPFAPSFLAPDPDGSFYVDDAGVGGGGLYEHLIRVYHGRMIVLWQAMNLD
ncbi:MAG TPA: hypothetical protein VMW47_13215 [Verrucomicrobiae bacterium]|nr:hypothetical protein [Verrucomicrobiae bacterium]